jgi:hypothetical protein
MHRRPLLVALSLTLLAASLGACAESASIPSPPPPAAEAPLFATDEEALEAATAAYAEYLIASGAVTSSDSLDASQLSAYVTDSYLAQEEAALQEFVASELRTDGESRLQSALLQQHFENEMGGTIIVIYACVDVSGVTVLDEVGTDVTPLDRAAVSQLEVELVSADEGLPRLLINRSQSWMDSSACE